MTKYHKESEMMKQLGENLTLFLENNRLKRANKNLRAKLKELQKPKPKQKWKLVPSKRAGTGLEAWTLKKTK